MFTAIGLIRRAPKMFQELISLEDKPQDIFSKGEATQKNVNAAINVARDHLSGQYLHDKAMMAAGTVKNMVPGSSLAKGVKSFKKAADDKFTQKTAEAAARKNGIPKYIAKQASNDLGAAMKQRRELEKKEKERKQKNLEENEKARQEWESTE